MPRSVNRLETNSIVIRNVLMQAPGGYILYQRNQGDAHEQPLPPDLAPIIMRQGLVRLTVREARVTRIARIKIKSRIFTELFR